MSSPSRGGASGQRLASSRSTTCVYLLRCAADDSLYTGWTVDLERRLAAHAAGRASRYTRSRLPVELVAVIPMADQRAARREEVRVKRLSRTQKLELAVLHAPPRRGR